MEGLFNNTHIISWLQYFSDNTDIDLEHVKILDITKKNKNINIKQVIEIIDDKGIENLRSKVTNSTAYRTRKCNQFFELGYCPYGSRCQFQHQLKSNIINNPYDPHFHLL